MSAGAGGGRAGMVFGLAAFGMWGLLPLYWRLLEDLGALEVLSHRMVWSLPTALVILLLVRSWSWIGPLLRRPKQLAMVALSATLISVNWGLFIWATLPDFIDTTDLLARALRENVAFVPGEGAYLDGRGRSSMRLNFSGSDDDAVREGVRRIGKVE